MSTPSVEFLASNRPYHLAPGDIVGRMSTAACRLLDPRISEAHAMVSLRGRGLYLLALRGRLEVDGSEEAELRLEPGLVVTLADGVDIQVASVILPGTVLAARLDGGAPQELGASVYSVVLDPAPEVVPRFLEGAPAHVMSTSEGWVIRIGDAPSRPARAGSRFDVNGHRLEFLSMSLDEASAASTQNQAHAYKPLTIVARHTTLHLHRTGRTTALINGRPAQLVSELVAMGGSAPWDVIAGEIWRNATDRLQSRRNFDRALERLRNQLAQCGIRDNLVRSDGKGNFELFLLPGDTVRDES